MTLASIFHLVLAEPIIERAITLEEPFLKYPANPPGVGDPETIGHRQVSFDKTSSDPLGGIRGPGHAASLA